MLDELVVDRPFVVENLMGISRLIVQHQDGNIADVVVILKVDDQQVGRLRFVAVSHELIEFAGRVRGQFVKGHRPFDQGLELRLKGTGGIEDARLLGRIAEDAAEPFIDVFIDDVAAEVEGLLGHDADVGIEIKNMEHCCVDHHNLYHPLRLFS